MKVLRLVRQIRPTSASYHQFTVPLLDEHYVTLCSYQPAAMPVDCRINYRPASGSVRSFLRVLTTALREQTFDVVHLHDASLALLWVIVAAVVRPSLLRRSIVHVHRSFPAYSWRQRWALLPTLLVCGRVVCCSHSARFSFPLVHRLLAGRRLITLRHGADVRRADRVWVRGKFGTIDRTDDLQLISIGSLHRLQNYETVLRALSGCLAKDIQLTIVGEGPARQSLARLADKLGIAQRVHLVGEWSRDATLQALWAADGFLSLARSEGLPTGVLEAMCCHCPVLLSDIPAHREIRGRRCDLIPLLDTHDVGALSDALDDWAGMPMDVMRAWGADCRQHVERDFALSAVLEQFRVLLDAFDPVMTPEWDAYCRAVRAGRGRRVA